MTRPPFFVLTRNPVSRFFFFDPFSQAFSSAVQYNPVLFSL